MEIRDEISIILVTSPIVSHPSTELIEKVVSSFDLVQGLNTCSLIIVGDGVREGRFRPKKGSVSSEMIDNYHKYLDNLHQMTQENTDSIWSNTRVISMKEHVGFGHAVYHALNLCHTEYVLVVQHDHPFSLEFR